MTEQTLGERLLEHNSALQNTIIGLEKKLFEAGHFAGQQQLTIDRQAAAMTRALLVLAEGWELLPDCRDYIAQAMEILAND